MTKTQEHGSVDAIVTDFRKRMDGLMGKGKWEISISKPPAPIIPRWCDCENRDAEVDGHCADCGGEIRQQ